MVHARLSLGSSAWLSLSLPPCHEPCATYHGCLLSVRRPWSRLAGFRLTPVAFVSIIAAVLITMIAISIQHPGGKVKATVSTDLNHAFLAVTNIIFGYGTVYCFDTADSDINPWTVGNIAFFSFISEMKAPSEFPKALYLLQTTDTTMYIVAAIVIYYYGGKDVTSPALGSTGPLVRKIAYGVAIPTVAHPPLPSYPLVDTLPPDCRRRGH